MDIVFDKTRERVARWAEDPEVLGVLLVGSKSRGHGDQYSDDDLEVVLTDEAAARIRAEDCSDVLIEGEGDQRKMIYDAQYLGWGALEARRSSPFDLDHWPYEKAPLLFDRTGALKPLVVSLGDMTPEFRRARLLHATIDAMVPPYRAAKCLKRGQVAAAHLLVARGAMALCRMLFALEWRWVPLAHWLQAELSTLRDSEGVGPLIVEALETNNAEPLKEGLARLERELAAEGVPERAGRNALFMQLIHPARAEERAIHGLQ